MNYYIQGNAAKAEQIKAAFEELGYDTKGFDFSCGLFFTVRRDVHYWSHCVIDVFKTHPDYKELELPVEPKFKAEDWLVYKDGCTFCGGLKTVQVQTVEKDRYIFTNGTKSTQRFIDRECRLWTIQDAKDGDVLAYQDEIFIARIARGLSVNVAIDYDCCYDGNSFILDSFYSLTVEELKRVYPATKEQRDLLFAKMKEAGYQWDEKKKELRRIKLHYDINNFNPFDKVLVRDNDRGKWRPSIFSYHIKGRQTCYPFCCIGNSFSQCIPFEGNEHLLGTTDMPDERFINW